MKPEQPSVFMDLFFYWLAALPLLVALLVWLYFWRQKQLVKIMMVRGPNCNICPSSTHSMDKPPAYDLYESYPAVVHKNGDITIVLEEEVPPPTYLDAVKKVAKNHGNKWACNCRSSSPCSRSNIRTTEKSKEHPATPTAMPSTSAQHSSIPTTTIPTKPSDPVES